MARKSNTKSKKDVELNSNEIELIKYPNAVINSRVINSIENDISSIEGFKSTIKGYNTVQKIIDSNKSILDIIDSQSNIPKYFDYFQNTNTYLNSISKINESITLSKTKETLQDEINELKKELLEVNEISKNLQENSSELQIAYNKALDINKKLKDSFSSLNILSRINTNVEKILLNPNQKLLHKFNHLNKCNAIVVSIDIRRSTELMLKANSSEKFAEFITSLSDKLSICIKENYGVFDKFTGDGILAFFPDFFSGKDSILFALNAAQVCHQIFEQHYNEFEDSFDVFLENIGLGIGIDYGEVSIVNTKAELTVVGKPVVYACRFSSAKAGETLMGQNAKKLIDEKFYQEVNYEKSTIFIKNEGDARCFKLIRLNFDIEEPEYSQYLESDEIFDNNDSKENLNV